MSEFSRRTELERDAKDNLTEVQGSASRQWKDTSAYHQSVSVLKSVFQKAIKGFKDKAGLVVRRLKKIKLAEFEIRETQRISEENDKY